IMDGTIDVTQNYAVTQTPGKLTITKASIAVTFTGESASKPYTGSEQELTGITASGLLTGHTYEGLTYSAKGTNVGTYDGAFTGTVKIMDGTIDVTQNYAVTQTPGTLTITKAGTLTVTGVDGEKVYDGMPLSTTATTNVSTGTTIEYSIDGGTTWTTTAPSITDVADSCTVQVRATNPNYTTATSNYTLTVTPAAVTVTADNKTKTYGDIDPTFKAKVAGLVNNESESLISYALSRKTGEDVGEYAITPTGAAAQGNYTVTYKTGTLTITAKTVTVTAKSEAFKYDGAAHSNAGYDVVGLVGSDAITAVVTGSITYPSESPVTNVLTSYSFTTGKAGNYTVTTKDGALTMTYDTAVALSITADSGSWTYDGDTHTKDSYTLSIGGGAGIAVGADGKYTFANGDVLTVVVTGSVKDVADGTVDNKIASCTIMNGTQDVSGAYALTQADGTLKITAKTVTVTADDKTKTYGDSDPTFTVTMTGLVIGEAESLIKVDSLVREPGETVAGSPYAITPTGAAAQGNYAVIYVDGALTITKAGTLTVTGVDGEKVYNGTPLSTTATTNVSTGTTIEYSIDGGTTWTTTAPSITDVADNCTVQVRATNPNYTTATDSYKLTITQRPVTFTGKTDTKTYTGSEQELTGITASGLLAGHTYERLTYSAKGTNVGEYAGAFSGTVVIKNASDNVVTDNYAVTETPGKLTITPKAITIDITGDNATHDYDGAEHTASGFTTTAPTGSDISIALKNNASAEAKRMVAGKTPMGLTKDSFDVTSSNYTVTIGTVTDGYVKIDPVEVTVTAEDKTKTYGDADPTLTATVTGLVNNESKTLISYALNRKSGENVGDYTIIPSGDATQGNYTVTYATGTLTINAKAVVVKADDKTKIYGADDPTFTATATGLVGSDTLTYDVTRAAGEDVAGSPYAITPSGAAAQGNYTVTYESGELTITKAALVVRADDSGKQLGDGDPELTSTVTGIAGRDDETAIRTALGITLTRTVGENLGSYPIIADGAAEIANYTVTYVPGTFRISFTFYRVQYLDWNGTAVYDNSYLGLGSVVAVPGGPSREGYIFTGWAFESGIELAVNGACRGNAVYRATYAPTQASAYTVRFEDHDGTLISETTYNLGDVAAYPTDPTRDGFDFTGWEYYKGVSLGAGDTVRGDVTYRAAYTAQTVEIVEPQTPQAAGSAWALLNLILTILTALISVILLVGYFGRKDKDEEDEKKTQAKAKKDEEDDDTKRKGFWRLGSLIPTLGAIITFILTENMKNPMVFTDKWTLLMAVIAIVQIVVAFLSRKSNKDDDEDKAKTAKA
ncbi:MAG: MBG domain-containing protein, partial [Oscillospiraceae bacterium]|nr:MBG domain-containing protein [Oscillospiraceae bacterium]